MANSTEQLLQYFQQSEKGNEKLDNLWEEFSALSNTEKLVFCLNLPTGAQRECNRDVQGKLKPEVTQATAWIKTHLHAEKEQCMAKQEVFEDYLHFCKKQNVRHIGREDFGKLMKTIYPSVTTRRLGMRGQTKHCYGGLAKKSDVEAPVLPEIRSFKSQADQEEPVKSRGKCENVSIERRDVVKACCAVIVEWAQKLLNERFTTINDIAEHLVLKSYVNVSSEAAYTILSQVPKYREDNSSTEQPVSRSTPPFCQQVSSGGIRNAKLQLQMKLQEKEKLKEQKRKLEEQRCAITGDTPPCDDLNDSGDTVSYDASVSSETTTTNLDHLVRSVTVPKPILPKPVPLVIPPSSTLISQPPSSIGSKNSSFMSIGQNPLPLMPQRPPSTPLFIVSPTPNSNSVNPMLLVSPLSAGTTANYPPSFSAQSQQQIQPPASASSAASVAATPPSGNSTVECDINSGASIGYGVNNGEVQQVMDTDGAFSDRTSSSNNSDVGATMASGETRESSERQQQTNKSVSGPGKASAWEEKPQEVLQRSQSMPESIDNTCANSVIDPTDSRDQLSQNENHTVVKETPNIKQENTSSKDNITAQNIPQGVYINFKLGDTDSGPGGTNVAVPIGTLDTTAITNPSTDNDTSGGNEASTNIASNIVSALNAQILAMLQSTVGGKGLAPQPQKKASKTVSSLLKEQRVRASSPDSTGKNRYVNDNRPVAQILKEIREKKKSQSLSPRGATQNLSFISESSTPGEGKEQLASQKILIERIEREAMVMRKAQVPTTSSITRPRRKSKPDHGKDTKVLVSSPARSPINAVISKKKDSIMARDSPFEPSTDAVKVTKSTSRVSSPKHVSVRARNEDDLFPNTVGNESITNPDDAEMSAQIVRKESAVLKLLFEEALGKETVDKVLTGRNVAASTNPKLASLLSNNNEPDIGNRERPSSADFQKRLLTQLLQKISESTAVNKTPQIELQNSNKMTDCNAGWDQNPNPDYREITGYHTVEQNGGNLDFQSQTGSILDLVTQRNMENEIISSRSQSCMEMNSAFMPIQSVADGNIASPVEPQAKTMDSNLTGTGTQMNAKLKALLSQNSSRQNSPIDHAADDIYNNTAEWVSRQQSGFVPYSQNCGNVLEENIPLNMNIGSSDLQSMSTSTESNAFPDSNSSTEFMLNNTGLGSLSNNNSGFASMIGVKPPMKRCMDSDRGYSNKRSRHLSDQSHIRPKRSEFATPIQPLIPQEQTLSHESLPMASPSSHGYAHCPPESPFSPEVHDIMSNPSDVFAGDFNSGMGSNNLRSLSVPAHNFMQGDVVEMGMGPVNGGAYLAQDGMQCAQQNYSGTPQQLHGQQQQGIYGYHPQQQQQQHQPTAEGNISNAYSSDNNNSASYNNVKKNLLQILESRLASEVFRNATNQSLRGDHMISGASVKLPVNMRHKISETLNSVMLQNMNQSAPYAGNTGVMHDGGGGNAQMNLLQVPNPTPPQSHPPTPVEFCSEMGEKFDGNHGYHMGQQQQVSMGCNLIPTTAVCTPTSLENVSSQSSRESLVDPLFNMCEEGSGAIEMQANNQFDFLRIL